MTEYQQKIKVYNVIQEIHIPLSESPDTAVHLKPDEIIVCIDTVVWLPDIDQDPFVMSQAAIRVEFIELNKKFFKLL